MNAGGVDKACKSSGAIFQGSCDYIKRFEIDGLAANELVTPWYVPGSRAQRVERSANSRYCSNAKGARKSDRFRSGLGPISLLAG
jgi:hypothetical protein